MTRLALLALPMLLGAPAVAQVTIDSRGVRAGGTTIDATGVHQRGARVAAADVHARGGARGRVVDGNRLTQRIDCAGGTVTINGNANDLAIANCRSVTVAGNRNQVAVRFGVPGRLTVLGNGDRVTYSAPPRVPVTVSNVGTRSTVTRR